MFNATDSDIRRRDHHLPSLLPLPLCEGKQWETWKTPGKFMAWTDMRRAVKRDIPFPFYSSRATHTKRGKKKMKKNNPMRESKSVENEWEDIVLLLSWIPHTMPFIASGTWSCRFVGQHHQHRFLRSRRKKKSKEGREKKEVLSHHSHWLTKEEKILLWLWETHDREDIDML